MHADENVLAVADLAADERDVRLAVDLVLEGIHAEHAELGRQLGGGDALDQRLGPHAVLDQIRDRDHQQAVLLRELRQLRHARHRAVLVHDFADDAGRIQPGDSRQIDRGLGLTGAHHHAARLRTQREHVPGRARSAGARRRIDRRQHGGRPIVRRNAGRRAAVRHRSARRTRFRTATCCREPSAESGARRAARRSSTGRSARGRTAP